MRRASLLLFLPGFALIGFAANAPQQQDKPKKAEEEFKNIKILKGEDASSIVPAMQFMSASLGVDCDYCHTQKGFDDDGKKEKDSAREMITMMRDINTKNFNGRTQVTCMTCHGGHTNPVSAPTLMGASPRIKADSTLTPDSVMSKYRTAIGGDASLGALKTVHLKGTLTIGTQPPLDVDVYQGSPNKLLRVIHTKAGDQKQGYNGTVAWVNGANGSFALDPADSGRVVRAARFYREAASMPVFQNASAGTGDVDGKTLTAIRGRLAEGGSEILYFDPSTGLLSRAVYYVQTILGSMPEVFDYEDYRKVGDVMIPFKMTQHTTSRTVVQQVTSADPNPTLDAAMFDMPK